MIAAVVVAVVVLRWRDGTATRGGAGPDRRASAERDQEGARAAASPANAAVVAPGPADATTGSGGAPPVPGAPAAPLADRARELGTRQAIGVESLNEAVLMARLRSAAGTDDALAIVLARTGNRRFPDSPDAPERSSILIHALASQGEARDARAEAEYMVNHYADSSWVREVEGFTGAHRHRNAVVTDAGTIEYR